MIRRPTHAQHTRRERKSALYMQCSCGELKDCSLWLRNLIATDREVLARGSGRLAHPSRRVSSSRVSVGARWARVRSRAVSVIVLPKMSAAIAIAGGEVTRPERRRCHAIHEGTSLPPSVLSQVARSRPRQRRDCRKSVRSPSSKRHGRQGARPATHSSCVVSSPSTSPRSRPSRTASPSSKASSTRWGV